jgi:hypothetical protein
VSAETEADRPYEVTFTNAINGHSFRRRYGSREEAESAAETERPFNNTRTSVRAVGDDAAQDMDRST